MTEALTFKGPEFMSSSFRLRLCITSQIHSILLGHYDLGWHLAAGDLIRDRGSIPFHDPWSFTAGDKQWFNLSWLWDVVASVILQYAGFGGLTLAVVACGAVIVGYLASLCLNSGASAISICIAVLAACLLYPAFASYPNVYLAASPNIATMLFSVIFYGECLKKNEVCLFAACHHGPVGQPAWRLFAWFSHYRRFLRRGIAEAGLEKFRN